MVKDIHKKYLKSRYSRPDIRNVRRIGIDEFATNKGHVYRPSSLTLTQGASSMLEKARERTHWRDFGNGCGGTRQR